MPQQNQHNGFSLLEVVVAMAILTIALVSIYELHGQTAVMSGKARFYTIAPQLAKAKLSEIEDKKFDDIGDGSDEFGDDHPGYRWAVTVEDMPTDFLKNEKYHLVHITIEITQENANTYQLRTYRFFAE